MADADEDEFTFPAAAAANPPFESPPLWRRPENTEFGETEGELFRLCACCDYEEKMDLLWEGLDEECCSGSGGKVLEDSESGSPVRICCVKKMSRASGEHAINIGGLKESVLVLIRFLMKKGLAMHTSRSSLKKLAW